MIATKKKVAHGNAPFFDWTFLIINQDDVDDDGEKGAKMKKHIHIQGKSAFVKEIEKCR